MSKLKVYRDPKECPCWREFYQKSEADEVIAELEDKLKAANKQIENLINSASSIMLFQDRVNDDKCAELRHSNYKRCLTMAKVCYLRFVRYENYLQKLCASNATIAAYKFRRDMYDKWEKRWLELAEEFKEEK